MSDYKIYTDSGSSTNFPGVTTTIGNNYWYYPADFPYGDSSIPRAKQDPTYPSYPQDLDFKDKQEITTIKKELNKLKKKLQNKEISMKNLFNVVVVSTEEKVLLDVKVVASDRDEASFAAGVHKVIEENKLKPKDVSILINDLGQVRVKKEPQKMIVVEEDKK